MENLGVIVDDHDYFLLCQVNCPDYLPRLGGLAPSLSRIRLIRSTVTCLDATMICFVASARRIGGHPTRALRQHRMGLRGSSRWRWQSSFWRVKTRRAQTGRYYALA